MRDDTINALILLSFGGGFALAVMLLSAAGIGGTP